MNENRDASPPVTRNDGLPSWQRERRNQIVRAALELLDDGEYEQVQVRDVAERSGFALGTLYRYFQSKEHLYAAVLVEWGRSFDESLARRPLRGGPQERTKQVARRVLTAFERKPQFLRLRVAVEHSPDVHARATLRELGLRNKSAFAEALPGIEATVAASVIDVVTSVLAAQLDHYASGHVTMKQAERVVFDTIDLIFSPPPAVLD